MYQYFVAVFFALGYLGSSNAIHPSSIQYIGSVDELLNISTSPENLIAHVKQDPEWYAKTLAMINSISAKVQQNEDSYITKTFKAGKLVLPFFQQASNSETCTELSKQFNFEALSGLSTYPQLEVGPQLVETAVASIKEAGEEVFKEFNEYLKSALDALENNQSNLSYKLLTKIDLLLSFYERTNGTGSFPSSSQISDEDKQLAADIPKILGSLQADFLNVSAVAEALKSACM